MGFVKVKVVLENISAPEDRRELELVVDTGAVYSIIPRAILDALGVAPRTRVEFELADGRRIRRDVGEVRFHLDGQDAISRVIFGDEGDALVLGVVTMEELGLEVDPFSQQVRPSRMLLYGVVPHD